MAKEKNYYTNHKNERYIRILRPEIIYSRMNDQEYILLTMQWLYAQHKETMCNECKKIEGYGDIFTCSFPKGIECVNFYIPLEKMDEFKEKVVPHIQTALENTVKKKKAGRYDKTEFARVWQEINYALDAVVREEDTENMRNNVGENWKKMLEDLNNPEIRKKMLLYQCSNKFASKYGWRLSPLNVINVLAQKPDATFVTSARNWERTFNRTVNPGAQRILISKPDNNKWQSKEELDTAAQQLGFKNYHQAMVATQSSRQVAMGIQFTDKFNDKNKAYISNHVVYDVMDTTPINAQHDTWAEELGLANNLTGEPNDALRRHIADNNLDPDKDKKEAFGVKKEFVEKFKDNVLGFCKSKGIDVSDMGINPEAVLTNAIYAYAMSKAESLNLLKKENQMQFAKSVVAAICCSTDIPSPIASSYLSSHHAFTKEECYLNFAIYTEIMKLVPNQVADKKTRKKSVNESVMNVNSFDEYVKLMQKLNTTVVDDAKEGLTEEFNNFWNRLNAKNN